MNLKICNGDKVKTTSSYKDVFNKEVNGTVESLQYFKGEQQIAKVKTLENKIVELNT